MKPQLVTTDNTAAIVRRVRALALADLAVLAHVSEMYPADDDVVLTEAMTAVYCGATRRAYAEPAE